MCGAAVREEDGREVPGFVATGCHSNTIVPVFLMFDGQGREGSPQEIGIEPGVVPPSVRTGMDEDCAVERRRHPVR